MTAVFALTTRGLEDVAASEMAALTDVTLLDTGYRRVAAECAGSPAALLGLQTVDDVYLELERWRGIGHTRDMLAVLREAARELDIEYTAEVIGALRDVPAAPLFSVTASFVGKRNFNVEEIKRAVAQGVATGTDWTYTPDDETAAFNVRVFIDHETAIVGVRLGNKPLHERNYRAVERMGALKPPVAAAMVRLTELHTGQTLLDPCCGSGTILLEAAAMGAACFGGDFDAQAVQDTRANMRAAGAHLRVDHWDARRLPLDDASVDAVVTNLPWGRQIALDEALSALYGEICLEIERVLRTGGRAVLLTTSPELLDPPRWNCRDARDSMFGQNPVISVFRSGQSFIALTLSIESLLLLH